jgi:hypothetical protein
MRIGKKLVLVFGECLHKYWMVQRYNSEMSSRAYSIRGKLQLCFNELSMA